MIPWPPSKSFLVCQCAQRPSLVDFPTKHYIKTFAQCAWGKRAHTYFETYDLQGAKLWAGLWHGAELCLSTFSRGSVSVQCQNWESFISIFHILATWTQWWCQFLQQSFPFFGHFLDWRYKTPFCKCRLYSSFSCHLMNEGLPIDWAGPGDVVQIGRTLLSSLLSSFMLLCVSPLLSCAH